MKILLVDDDKDLCQIIKTQFEQNNFNVVIAYNGKEALEKIEEYQNEFKIIITDIKMPVMDGIEFLEILSEKYENNLPEIVVLSRKTEVDLKINAYTVGAIRYLTKPFNVERLLKIVNEILYNKEDYSIKVISHYDNVYTFNTSTNYNCIKELADIISQLIKKINLKKNEKLKLLSNINNILIRLEASENDMFDLSKVSISYITYEQKIELVIEVENNEELLNYIKNYIKNFIIDFKIYSKKNFLKITKIF